MRFLPAFIAATAFASPLAAQQPGVPSPEVANAQATAPAPSAGQPTTADVANIRVNQLVIFEGDTCPPSEGETINVCAILPGAERFRIPENLRRDPNAPENQSWTNQAIALSYVGASGIGSCSTSGPGGMTGCNQQLINQYVGERRGRPEVNWARLIEEARQERLGQINARSAEEERTADGRTPRRVQDLRIRQGEFCPPSTEAVIILCTYPDGSPAPIQPASATPPQPQRQAQPQPPRP
jgi:hypothetical protein